MSDNKKKVIIQRAFKPIQRADLKEDSKYYYFSGLLSDTSIDNYNTRFTSEAIRMMAETINRSANEGKPLKVEYEHLYTETDNTYWLFGDILSATVTDNDELMVDFGIRKVHPISALVNDMLTNPLDFHDFIPALSIVGSVDNIQIDYKTGLETMRDCYLDRMGVVESAGNPNCYINIARSLAKTKDTKITESLDKSNNKELVSIIRSAVKGEEKVDLEENVDNNEVVNNEVIKEQIKEVEPVAIEQPTDTQTIEKTITINFENDDDLQTKLQDAISANLQSVLDGYTKTLNEAIANTFAKATAELADVKRSLKEAKEENAKLAGELKEVKRNISENTKQVKIISANSEKNIQRGMKMSQDKIKELEQQIEARMKEINELRENVEYMKRTPTTKLANVQRSAKQVGSQPTREELFIQTPDGDGLTYSEWVDFEQQAIAGKLSDDNMRAYKEIAGQLFQEQLRQSAVQQYTNYNNVQNFGGVDANQYVQEQPAQPAPVVQEPVKETKPTVDFEAKFNALEGIVGKLADAVSSIAEATKAKATEPVADKAADKVEDNKSDDAKTE